MPNGMGIGTVLVSRNHLRSTSAGVESSLEPPRLISDQALNKSQFITIIHTNSKYSYHLWIFEFLKYIYEIWMEYLIINIQLKIN